MRDKVYITFDKNGIKMMRKTLPRLGAGEYAVLVRLEVPDAVFRRFIPEASITVPEEGFVIEPTVEVELGELPPLPAETEPTEDI